MNRRLLFILRLLSIASAVLLFISYISTAVRPGLIPYLPIVGLAFPFLLLANLFFLVFWLLRRSAWMLMQGAVILVGLGFITDVIQVNGPAGESDESVRIMSYNVRLFGYYQWTENDKIRDRIFDRLKTEDAGIMCFQEFYHSPPGRFQTKKLLLEFTETPYIHEKYTHEFSHNQYFGVVTLSRYPIIHKGYIPFEGGYQNFCIYSDVLFPSGDTVRVFNGHLASIHFGQDEYALVEGRESSARRRLKGITQMAKKLNTAYTLRAQQIETVMKEVEISPYPVIFCGDFNDSPTSYCYRRATESLDDSFLDKGMGIGNTYNGSFPSFRIDYVLHSKDLEVLDYRSPTDQNSDHFPIIVDLKMRED